MLSVVGEAQTSLSQKQEVMQEKCQMWMNTLVEETDARSGKDPEFVYFLLLRCLKEQKWQDSLFLDSIELSRFSLKPESMFSCILHCLKNVDVLKIVRCLHGTWLISISVWPTEILWSTVKSTIFCLYRKLNNLNHISITRNRF